MPERILHIPHTRQFKFQERFHIDVACNADTESNQKKLGIWFTIPYDLIVWVLFLSHSVYQEKQGYKEAHNILTYLLNIDQCSSHQLECPLQANVA